MKRFPVLGILLLIPAIALLVLVGCGGGDKKTTGGTPTAPTGKTDNKTALEELKGEPKGIVKGKVSFKGDPPALEDLPDLKAEKAADKAFCLKGGGIHVKKQTWLVKDKGVANVVVSLEPPEGKKFKIDDKLKEWHKANPEVINQPYCQYVPHVRAVYGDVQELIFTNKSEVIHNVRAANLKNQDVEDFNKTMKPGGPDEKLKLKHQAAPVAFNCSVHGWMNAKVVTFQHPYFAVTKDDGSFEIKNVPIGEDLVVFMWHESMDKKESKETKKFVEGANSLELEISK